MVSIFNYLDYRDYLRAIFESYKMERRSFSHRNLARRLKLAAPGHILFVIQGKRRLTESVAMRLIDYLKLGKREADYLLFLITYANAKDSAEKQYAFERLSALRRRSSRVVNPDQYAFYEKWYYSAIRAMLDIEPFKDNYRGLAHSLVPPIGCNEAKEAVELLERIGCIHRDEQGFYHPVDPIISTGEVWQSATITNLQKQFAHLSSEALDRIPRELRDISNITVTLSKESFEIAKKKAKELRAQILELARAEAKPDRVLQCNLSLFPLFISGKESKL